MKILYDYQVFDMQKVGGISRYHSDLYQGCKQEDLDPMLGLKYTSNRYLLQQGLEFSKSYSSEDKFLFGFKFKHKHNLFRVLSGLGFRGQSSWDLNAVFCRECLKSNKYDIFHPTYYDDLYSDIEIKTPLVLTIHDMIYEAYPHFFNDISVIRRKKILAERANAVIAISEFTKNEILKYYDDIDESKIHVVHHGIDLSDIDDTNSLVQKGGYILYVGDRLCYKDCFTLFRAMKILKQNHRDVTLVNVGRPFNDLELSYIEFLGLNAYVKNLGRVSDDKLKDLYAGAQLLVSTSMSEGFGLPLLESMKYGTPMVLSDIPAYKEVAGNSAVYYKTCDDKSLAEVISCLYYDTKLQEDLIRRGRERVMLYDKNDMIKHTIEIYKNLL